MPRDLSDVLHHLIPEAAPPSRSAPPKGRARQLEPARLPLVAVLIGERDVVRAAFTWNLAVEMARIGAAAAVVAPASDRSSALWPEEDVRPMGADVILVPATSLLDLQRAAQEVASERAKATDEGGVIFVRVPPLWLRQGETGMDLLRWTLLLTSSEKRDLLEAYGITKLLGRLAPGGRVGVTIHGARHKGEAERAFKKLAGVAARRLGVPLASYGLLVDDLHVYRAIVAQRPIGMVHPQSPAARSMRDVAELLLADARIPHDA
jgi:hypothetical protein